MYMEGDLNTRHWCQFKYFNFADIIYNLNLWGSGATERSRKVDVSEILSVAIIVSHGWVTTVDHKPSHQITSWW